MRVSCAVGHVSCVKIVAGGDTFVPSVFISAIQSTIDAQSHVQPARLTSKQTALTQNKPPGCVARGNRLPGLPQLLI